MADIFLCGALAHEPLLNCVLGTMPQAGSGRLDGHAPVPVADGDLTGVCAQAGATAEGLLLRGLAAPLARRLEDYLAVFGLALAPVGGVRAVVVPGAAGTAVSPWSQPDWLSARAPAVLRAAEEIAAHLPTLGPAGLAARLMQIRMRAVLWAQSRAGYPATGKAHDPEHDIDRDVIVHRVHRPYLNFFSLQEMDLQFRKQDGSFSEVVNRGALMMGEAAAVLPYDPVRDEVLLIQQFRAPLYMGGTRAPWVWEPPAGLVDPGETPEQTAHREAMEEAGLTLRRLVPVGPTHGSPGSLSDRLNLFVGLTDLSETAPATGVDSEGEDIRSRILSFDAFMEGIDAQAYPVLPLLALGLWLARHRDRLRAMA